MKAVLQKKNSAWEGSALHREEENKKYGARTDDIDGAAGCLKMKEPNFFLL